MLNILVILLFLLLCFLGVRSKIYLSRQRQKDLPEIINSPVSQALTQLLGVAGGIYLSLIMLSSFLSLEVPEQVSLAQFSIDPLALFSILITLIQPIIMRLIKRIYF
ncbi:MAG: hypothetical protein ACOWWO_18625 [Peptococcaceae bacterium]